MKRLKITFELQSPVLVPNGMPIHLDGLLAFAATQRRLTEIDHGERPCPPDTLAGMRSLGDLTGILDYDERGVFKASCLMLQDQHAIGQVVMIRRTDIESMVARADFDRDGSQAIYLGARPGLRGRDKISLDSGLLRNLMTYFPSVHAKSAVAYCIGDQAAIESLLSDIHSIGRKNNLGYGLIRAITIAETECDEWMMRNLTWDASTPSRKYIKSTGNIAAPYWDVTQRRSVWVPVDL